MNIVLAVLCAFGAIAGVFFASLFATDFFYYMREKMLQKAFQQAIKSNAYLFYNNKQVMDMKVDLLEKLNYASLINYNKQTKKFLTEFNKLTN